MGPLSPQDRFDWSYVTAASLKSSMSYLVSHHSHPSAFLYTPGWVLLFAPNPLHNSGSQGIMQAGYACKCFGCSGEGREKKVNTDSEFPNQLVCPLFL